MIVQNEIAVLVIVIVVTVASAIMIVPQTSLPFLISLPLLLRSEGLPLVFPPVLPLFSAALLSAKDRMQQRHVFIEIIQVSNRYYLPCVFCFVSDAFLCALFAYLR